MANRTEPKKDLSAAGSVAPQPTPAVTSNTKMDIEKPSDAGQPKQEDKNKCFQCKKKTGIYGFQCKCGYNYCKFHRIPEEHDCTFDFATVGRQQLEKNNPLLVGKKLDQL